MSHYSVLSRSKNVLCVALLLACGVSHATQADSKVQPAPVNPPPPSAEAMRLASPPVTAIKHQQQRQLTPADRAPQASSKEHLRSDYDKPYKYPNESSRLRAAAAAASCDVQALASASGSQLVSLIRAADVDGCINTLFNVTGTSAGQLFGEAKMATVADALRSDAASYPGSNANSTLQLILFLRAGYYVQYGDPADVGSYGSLLKNAIRPALDAFVANAHFHDVNDSHGQVLAEFVTLIDSSGENAHQLTTVRDMLDGYNSSYHSYWYMMSAVNNLFTVLFRGHYNQDFVDAVQANDFITPSLSNFISHNAAEAGTGNEYLLANAAREMSRFLQYASLAAVVQPEVKNILSAYGMTGAGASIWVATADIADYYDHAHCSYYGICDFRTQLAKTVLPVDYPCSADLHLRAQALTTDQVSQTCAQVIGEEGFFHQRVQNSNTPVADDHNSTLELVVFHSSSDYQTYSGAIFGNDTNNGGIYLEGDPSAAGNQARFIAYEAEWLRPTFQIWNLTHEFVHYLDGRFDMYGDFTAATSTPTIWWIEGLAEYMSYSYRGVPYPEAFADAGTAAFPLSTIFANDYNSGQERVYRWGYLATRYMFENHQDEVGNILGYFRPGNYSGYANYLGQIRTTHDADWGQWLTCLASHNGDTQTCGSGSGNPPPAGCPSGDVRVLGNGCTRNVTDTPRAGDLQYFYVLMPAGIAQLTISTRGGSGNADLYASASGWPSTSSYDVRSSNAGNNESVTISNPVAGQYYFIAVSAASPFSGVSISATLSPQVPGSLLVANQGQVIQRQP
ncbi:M9 family metallopeptidase [Dyella silvatica]|uniref:M9 family metallopeptidase n=1 Tax=Dyella silvatica TaxID=2992128 RepID=UPI00225085F2|nr:M9 family metallopeptidase [Dyella silvatica]